MDTPLLRTKLYVPPLRPNLVARPRLIERLNAGLSSGHKLTLVSAPAGFGKTTCICEWVNALDRPVAWLSLDREDDDPGRFFAYLVAALQKIDENLGWEIEGVLRAGQLPPSQVVSTTLINDILALEQPSLLVLDDLQVIQDQFILQVLERLVTDLAPLLHLVLLTREDPSLPLARLRANDQMTEIRAGDLRFTTLEADRFLNEAMGLSLSQADTATLETKTEGWVVGLQLAGLSVRDQANPSTFIATLSGSNRFILGYLIEQVLGRQPQEVQRFLLQTSILDKLSGDLCNAVTGRMDSHLLLERLLNANLFLVPLDDERRWYRYHRLFADLLRDRQEARHPDRMTELYQRASRWYAQAGMAIEAIEHALAASDYAMAVDLLESHATGMIMQGYAKTVAGWVQAIPAEWRSQSPRTNLAFAWMHLLRGAYAQASPYLDQVQAAFSDSRTSQRDRSSLEAEWLVIQALRRNMQGKMTESMSMATRALHIAPEQDSRVRSLAYYALAGVSQLMEDDAHAIEAYQMAIQQGRAAENLVAEMMSTAGLALIAFEHGQLHLAFEIAAPVADRLERSGTLPPIGAVIYGTLGEVCCQWIQVEQARQHTLRALQLSTLGGYNSGLAFCRVLLSRLSQLEGNLDAAAREIEQAVELVQGLVPDDVRHEVVAQQVHVYLGRGRPDAAQMALRGLGFSFQGAFSFPELSSDNRISHSTGLLYNSSLCVLAHRARIKKDVTGLGTGIELADNLIARALLSQQLLVALESLLLRAQMRALSRDAPTALTSHWADCVRALEMAEQEGIVGVFVEQGPPVAEILADLVKQDRLGTVEPSYVEHILAAFPRSQSEASTRDKPSDSDPPSGAGMEALIEPLTGRELDVLRLMAEGLKYSEIADGLFISLNTVRSHVKAIYGKLDVNNRTKAIERARQLQML